MVYPCLVLGGGVFGTFVFCGSGHRGWPQCLALQLETANTLAEAKVWCTLSGDPTVGFSRLSPCSPVPPSGRKFKCGGRPSLVRKLPLVLLTIAGRLEDWVEGVDGFQAAQFTSLPSSICGKLRRRQHCLPLTSSSVSQVPRDGLCVKEEGRQSQDHCGCGSERSNRGDV